MAEPITDERAREVYTMATQWVGRPDAEQSPSIVRARNVLRAEWDAWIAAHDAQVRAEALGGTSIEYAVAREEWPLTPVYKRRDFASAEAFVLNPPLGEKRHGWIIISRLVLTDNPWKPTNQQNGNE